MRIPLVLLLFCTLCIFTVCAQASPSSVRKVARSLWRPGERFRITSSNDEPVSNENETRVINSTQHEEHKKEHEGGQHDKCSAEALAEEQTEEAQEHEVRFTIVLGCFCLWLMFFCGYLIEQKHILWFPEAGAGIVIGVIAGLFVQTIGGSNKMTQMVRFDTEFFFIFLLPPIIFESGYNMKRQAFFRNLGGICLYAFIGTTVSTFIVGGLVYAFGMIKWCYSLGGLASLVFGALISATDPVTVLAVFQALHADIDLYSLVFGESVLNDAVAIVLYRTLMNFRCSVTATTVLAGFGSFLVIFIGSTLIGIAVALASSFITKYAQMQDHDHYLFLETCMLCIYPYAAFMLAEALALSGIVAILFCGIFMAHYTYNNLSKGCQLLSRQLFKVLAQLSESFVFVYLGMAMFTYPQTWSLVKLVILAFIACLIARVFNIVPNTLILNLSRSKPTSKPGKVSIQYQFLMWFSGLRGAVAFVLAVSSFNAQVFPEKHDPAHPTVSDSDAILTVTLFIAVITIFGMGGPIAFLLRYFDALETSTEEEVAAYTGTGLMGRDKSRPMAAKGAIYYDRKYVKPFFTHYKFQEGAEPMDERNENNDDGPSTPPRELTSVTTQLKDDDDDH